MWAIIFGIAFVAAISCFAYLCHRAYKMAPSRVFGLGGDAYVRQRLFLSMGTVIAVISVFSFLLGYINAVIIVIHTVIFGLLADLLFFVIKKLRGKAFAFNYAPALAVFTTFVYLTVGFALANCVYVTHYTIYTDKNVNLRIVMFADSHVGTTFSGAEFAKYVKKMQSYDPDIVVIAGDYVDDDTSRKDMADACKALGTLKTAYGVYYVFGNHDKGYYDNSGRGYTGDDLIVELTKNGVTVLQDQVADCGDFCVIGRKDRSELERGDGRADIGDLMLDIDGGKYSVVINHQPTDYDAESRAKADLVLSGHTHGGQMIPIGWISDIFGLNDSVYGRERRGNTDFIVTSGISDWAFKFKTGCVSEFVVIDVNGN